MINKDVKWNSPPLFPHANSKHQLCVKFPAFSERKRIITQTLNLYIIDSHTGFYTKSKVPTSMSAYSNQEYRGIHIQPPKRRLKYALSNASIQISLSSKKKIKNKNN